MKKLKFEELNLSPKILRAVSDMGFEEASPIQSATIPVLLEGKDVIGQAQTGTGKTAAFAIPIIEKVNFESKQLQAVILCPTRELVMQVTEEFRKLFKYYHNLAVVPIYGGQEIERQIFALKNKPQIVVGTPGRMMDHMRRNTLKMETVKFVVLDEADEMLDMGFREDLEIILKDTPVDRQTILFSATMPDEIVKLTKNYQKDPVRIDVTGQKLDAPKIEQYYFDLQEKDKPEALARLIDYYGIKLALVFCNTKHGVDKLTEVLQTRGYMAEALHGDLNQRQRDRVMNGFRTGSVEILIATDVAGRGIDVNNVEAVFNYDLPRDDEDYIHRIGRTGRAGKKGKSFTFIVGRQIFNLKRIEKTNGLKIVNQHIPSLASIDETKIKSYVETVIQTLSEGKLGKYVKLAERIMGDEYSALDVAAALLKMSVGDKFNLKETESWEPIIKPEPVNNKPVDKDTAVTNELSLSRKEKARKYDKYAEKRDANAANRESHKSSSSYPEVKEANAGNNERKFTDKFNEKRPYNKNHDRFGSHDRKDKFRKNNESNNDFEFFVYEEAESNGDGVSNEMPERNNRHDGNKHGRDFKNFNRNDKFKSGHSENKDHKHSGHRQNHDRHEHTKNDGSGPHRASKKEFATESEAYEAPKKPSYYDRFKDARRRRRS